MLRKAPSRYGQCEHSGICKRGDVEKNGILSWYPRPDAIKPYCAGDKNPGKCAVLEYLENNPAERRDIGRRAGDGAYLASAAVTAALAPIVFHFDPSTSGKLFAAGSAFGCIASIASYLTRKFSKKTLMDFLFDMNARDGTDEIYQKIIESADGVNEVEDGGLYFWSPEMDHSGPGNTLSYINEIDGLEVTPRDVKMLNAGQTNFRIAKLVASYFFADDVPVKKNAGVAVSYEYESNNRVGKDNDPVVRPEFLTLGVMLPEIRRHSLTEGSGFVQGIMYVDDPMYKPDDPPAFFSGDLTEEMQRMLDSYNQQRENGPKVRQMLMEYGSCISIFGNERPVKTVSRELLKDKSHHGEKIHELMNEALFTSF